MPTLMLIGLRPCQTAFQAAFGMRDAGKGGNAGAAWRGCGGKTPRNGRNNSKRWGLAEYWFTGKPAFRLRYVLALCLGSLKAAGCVSSSNFVSSK